MPLPVNDNPEEFGDIDLGGDAKNLPEPESLPEKKEVLKNREKDEQEALKASMDEFGEVVDSPKLRTSATQAASDKPQAEKIGKLLSVAREKGVLVAVAMAKKMGDPYLLDILHDALAKEGLYKQFKE